MDRIGLLELSTSSENQILIIKCKRQGIIKCIDKVLEGVQDNLAIMVDENKWTT